MSNWEVENLRVTGFTLPSVVPEPINQLWAALVLVPPDQINERPKEATVTAEGSLEGHRLILSQGPGRTDWLWVADLDLTKLSAGFPSIGKFQTAPDIFVKLARTWLERRPPLTRLAWGGVIKFVVPNKEDGYRKLAEFLHSVKIDPVGSSEFIYQINRPRTSRVIDGMLVNRLSTWSVALLQPISIAVGFQPGQAVGLPTTPPISACRLVFDINSDATRTEPFEPRQLAPLLDELVELAAEIAVKGDIP